MEAAFSFYIDFYHILIFICSDFVDIFYTLHPLHQPLHY